MKKFISIMTIAALFAVSCDKATVGAPAEVEVVTPGLVKYTLTVNKPEDTKVTVDAQGALTWVGGEVLTISCEAWEQTYQSDPVVTISQDGKQAAVTFSAPEHEGAEVYVSLGSVAASVEGSQSPVLTGVASVEGAAEGQTGSVTLSPAAAHFRFTDIPSGVQSIKIAAVGGESVANEEAKLITVTGISGTECGVNILPDTYSKGLVLAFKGTNGAIVKSLSFNNALTLSANSLRNISLSSASPVQLAGTVTAKTTYSQAIAGEKGTDENGANNTANTNRVWDINHELTSVDNLSEALKSFVSFASYECDDQVLTSGNEFSSISLGEKDLKANLKFECGALSIPVGSLSTKVQITGLPYKVDNFANEASNWTPSNNSIAFKADGIYLYTPTGVPTCTLKNKFYFPNNVAVLVNAILSKQSSGLSSYETYVTLGSIKATTGSNRSGIDKKPYSAKGTINGEVSLVAGCSFGLANLTYNYAVNAIEILYN